MTSTFKRSHFRLLHRCIILLIEDFKLFVSNLSSYSIAEINVNIVAGKNFAFTVRIAAEIIDG